MGKLLSGVPGWRDSHGWLKAASTLLDFYMVFYDAPFFDIVKDLCEANLWKTRRQ